MIVYKVCYRNWGITGPLVSLFISGKAKVVYFENGDITYPSIDGTPLFAFDALVFAKYFSSKRSDTSVWKAEAEEFVTKHPSAKCVMTPSLACMLPDHMIAEFWEQDDPGYLYNAHPLLSHTVLCRWIRLIEEI